MTRKVIPNKGSCYICLPKLFCIRHNIKPGDDGQIFRFKIFGGRVPSPGGGLGRALATLAPEKNPFKGGRGAPWLPSLTELSRLKNCVKYVGSVINPGGLLGSHRFPLLGGKEGDRNQGARGRARDRKGRLYPVAGGGAGRRERRALPGGRASQARGAGGAGRTGPSHPISLPFTGSLPSR